MKKASRRLLSADHNGYKLKTSYPVVVHLYLACRVGLGDIDGDAEHQAVRWLLFEQAYRQLTYDDDREVPACARGLIEQNSLFRNICRGKVVP
ncbi:MAG: hypothetical protein JXB30_00800 [Anaerolineae bacterium]|nr:hypothetical protein [Anaerolineae bacterium]